MVTLEQMLTQSLTLPAVVELGDSLSDLESERCLLLANHQSTADVPLLMGMLSARRRAADNVLWIMDSMFRWTHFGMVSQVRGDFFVESVSAGRWGGGSGFVFGVRYLSDGFVCPGILLVIATNFSMCVLFIGDLCSYT